MPQKRIGEGVGRGGEKERERERSGHLNPCGFVQ